MQNENETIDADGVVTSSPQNGASNGASPSYSGGHTTMMDIASEYPLASAPTDAITQGLEEQVHIARKVRRMVEVQPPKWVPAGIGDEWCGILISFDTHKAKNGDPYPVAYIQNEDTGEVKFVNASVPVGQLANIRCGVYCEVRFNGDTPNKHGGKTHLYSVRYEDHELLPDTDSRVIDIRRMLAKSKGDRD